MKLHSCRRYIYFFFLEPRLEREIFDGINVCGASSNKHIAIKKKRPKHKLHINCDAQSFSIDDYDVGINLYTKKSGRPHIK